MTFANEEEARRQAYRAHEWKSSGEMAQEIPYTDFEKINWEYMEERIYGKKSY